GGTYASGKTCVCGFQTVVIRERYGDSVETRAASLRCGALRAAVLRDSLRIGSRRGANPRGLLDRNGNSGSGSGDYAVREPRLIHQGWPGLQFRSYRGCGTRRVDQDRRPQVRVNLHGLHESWWTVSLEQGQGRGRGRSDGQHV